MTDRRSGLRDRLGGSGRHHTDALVDVLPPGLPPEEARSKALREHNRVAKAFEGARAEVARLHEDYARAGAADEAAIRQAAREGKPAPEPRAPAIGQELEAAEHAARVLADELKMAAGDLLAHARDYAADAAAEAEQQALDAEEGAHIALASAAEAMERAGECEARSGWWSTLAAEGDAVPYQAGRFSREGQVKVRQVVAYLDTSREFKARHRAELARQAEHEARLPLPPTSAPGDRQPVGTEAPAS
jgi:hypothetical protein